MDKKQPEDNIPLTDTQRIDLIDKRLIALILELASTSHTHDIKVPTAYPDVFGTVTTSPSQLNIDIFNVLYRGR